MSDPVPPPPSGHVAIVTGANHGIGAATARALARRGDAVLVTFLRLADEPDPGTPEAYARARAGDGSDVVAAITDAGGRARAVEADLAVPDAAAPALFDAAEAAFGPVDILVNNASGWVADTFAPATTDRFGRRSRPVTPETVDRVLAVDARAAALLTAEFARRHAARRAGWGRIVGLTAGEAGGFPEEVSYGAAKAAQRHFARSAATELAPLGITVNLVHPPVTDTGWVNDAVAAEVAARGFHLATPDQVADVVCYLTSEAAELLTGNELRLR